jgi:hypothetical protein
MQPCYCCVTHLLPWLTACISRYMLIPVFVCSKHSQVDHGGVANQAAYHCSIRRRWHLSQECLQQQEEDRAQARAKADLRAFIAANEEHQAAKQTRKLQERAADRAFMVRPADGLQRVEHAVAQHACCRPLKGCAPVCAAPDGVHWILIEAAMHGKTQLVCAAATLSEPERALEMQAEYAAVMEKQEAARQKQLADAKARQARQVADAATRPEFKKWIDDDMIERNARFVTFTTLLSNRCHVTLGDVATSIAHSTARPCQQQYGCVWQGAAGGRSSRGGAAEGGSHSKEGSAAGGTAVAAAGAHGIKAAGGCSAAGGTGQHQPEHPGSCDEGFYSLMSLVTWKGTAVMCSMHPASCLQPQLNLGARPPGHITRGHPDTLQHLTTL